MVNTKLGGIGVRHINGHSSSRKGDLAEFYAVTWLWDNGYEVFKNCGCDGPVDLIATKDGETTMIDIKTRSNGGSNSSTRRSDLQKEMNVQILLYLSDTREFRFVNHKD